MPDQITKNGPLLVDVCSVATPDKTYFVPQEFPGKTVHSFGAAYYYTADKNNGCQYWICDITLNHLSNTHFHQPRTGPDVPPKTGHVQITYGAYDWPSSADFGGILPVMKYDCGAYKLQVRLYKKLWGDTGFKYVDRGTWEGLWQGNQCKENQIEGTLPRSVGFYDPPVGIDVYRFAVIVIQRGSAQEAKVSIYSTQE